MSDNEIDNEETEEGVFYLTNEEGEDLAFDWKHENFIEIDFATISNYVEIDPAKVTAGDFLAFGLIHTDSPTLQPGW